MNTSNMVEDSCFEYLGRRAAIPVEMEKRCEEEIILTKGVGDMFCALKFQMSGNYLSGAIRLKVGCICNPGVQGTGLGQRGKCGNR